MTTQEAAALARRAVACPRWRWMPGMSTHNGARVVRVDADQYAVGWYPDGYLDVIAKVATPDLTDPATLGCLLALVREAWIEPLARAEGYPDGWRVYVPRVSRLVGLGPSEAEALVAALEAAP